MNLAATNGFNDDGTNNTVNVYNPPNSGPYRHRQIKTSISRWSSNTEVDPIFSQFIYTGPQKQTVEAVVRYNPGQPHPAREMRFGALKKDGDSIVFNGTATTVIHGGNVFSNGYVRRRTVLGLAGSSRHRTAKSSPSAAGRQRSRNCISAADISHGADPCCSDFPPALLPSRSQRPRGDTDQHWCSTIITHEGSSITGANLILAPNTIHCIDGDLTINGSGMS